MLDSETKVFRFVAILSKPMRAVRQGARDSAGAVIALGVLVALLYLGRLFFITLLIAVSLAFLLEPFVAVLLRIRFPRSLASFVVCIAALTLLYLLGLGAYSQLAGLVGELPKYSERISDLEDNVRQKAETMEQRTYQLITPARQKRVNQAPEEAPPLPRKKRRGAPAPAQAPVTPPAPGVIPEVRIHEEPAPLKNLVSGWLGSFYQISLMASFVPFLVYFMLSWQEHVQRSFLQFFQGEDRAAAARSVQGIADMVRGFMVGNGVLGLLLAASSSLAFWLIHLPYPLLVGPLSGFLSLIPYIGLPLAILPPVFVALTAFSTVSAYLWLIAIISLLHLVALNLLYPKIVGSRVHLNPLTVTISLMLWGFLWGGAGLLLAIPLTAALKAVCDNVKDLRPLGKFLGD
jgi:predicted PurR-regulated permease PerM